MRQAPRAEHCVLLLAFASLALGAAAQAGPASVLSPDVWELPAAQSPQQEQRASTALAARQFQPDVLAARWQMRSAASPSRHSALSRLQTVGYRPCD